MSPPRVIGTRRPEAALAALVNGQVIAVPSEGGYQLAARHDQRGACAGLRRLGSLEEMPPHLVVGRRAQAIEFAPAASPETWVLADRMWPGPLTVIVPALVQPSTGEAVVHLSMPGSRAVRGLCRRSGPLAVIDLRRADGRPMIVVDDVRACFADVDVALIVDGGLCDGPGPTVVDCTLSPPTVRHVGLLPESYVDAALMMGKRRRAWFTKRVAPPAVGGG